jgi:ATP-dependent DNA helicase RecQ
MCRQYPVTSAELRRIAGVGDVKLERYGDDFLGEIRAYRESDRLMSNGSAGARATEA